MAIDSDVAHPIVVDTGRITSISSSTIRIAHNGYKWIDCTLLFGEYHKTRVIDRRLVPSTAGVQLHVASTMVSVKMHNLLKMGVLPAPFILM